MALERIDEDPATGWVMQRRKGTDMYIYVRPDGVEVRRYVYKGEARKEWKRITGRTLETRNSGPEHTVYGGTRRKS